MIILLLWICLAVIIEQWKCDASPPFLHSTQLSVNAIYSFKTWTQPGNSRSDIITCWCLSAVLSIQLMALSHVAALSIMIGCDTLTLQVSSVPSFIFHAGPMNLYRVSLTSKALVSVSRWHQRQMCSQQCPWPERSLGSWTWLLTVPASLSPLKPTMPRRTSLTAWRTSSVSSM